MVKLNNFLDNSPIFAILNSYRQLSSFQRYLTSTYGLNFYQSLIVSGLYFEEKETVSPQNLVDTLRTTKGTVSQCLTTLQEKKMLTIKVKKDDKRKQVLGLTKKGEDIAVKIIAFFDRNQSSLEEELGEDEISHFMSLLKVITNKNNF